MVIETIIAFIIILALLVLSHEFGHFIVARRSGAKVEEFGFGFPPRIFRVKRKGTVYSLNLIPLGGFVRILGEDGDNRTDPLSFASKKIYVRASIISAGVVMNFVLAFILLSIGMAIGLPGIIDDNPNAVIRDERIIIANVAPDSPADKAGLKLGDELKMLSAGSNESIEPKNIKQVQEFISAHKGEEVLIKIVRKGDQTVNVRAIPRVNVPEDEGALGIAMEMTGIISYPWYESIFRGLKATGVLIRNMIYIYYLFFKSLISQGAMLGEVAGPVGIASLTNQFAKMGLSYLIYFTAILSINLGLINALPIPALDGGRLLFLLFEKIKGSPINQRFEKTAHIIGFALLMVLIIFITYRDIVKLL